MNKLGLLCFVFCFIFSCSQRQNSKNSNKRNQTTHFVYKDPSGEYILKREVIEDPKRVKLRQALYLPSDMTNALEKSVTISEYGTVGKSEKSSLAIRPIASQFSIWYDKNKYFSQMKLNKQRKSFDLFLNSPDKKWQGNSEKKFVKGSKFCWFSQLPECLKRIINNSKKSKILSSFIIVWDSFPYYNEQYQNISGNLFIPASLKFDGKFAETYRFAVEFERQVIFYHYNKNLNFEKMVWVSQGITVEKNN
jgi:hypothetical protein